MNRPIKFRVRDTHLNIWVSNYGMGPNNTLTTGNAKRFHVLQYTGIDDRDGAAIYEGDLIKIDGGGTYEVVFKWGCFLVYEDENSNARLGELERLFLKVVGNIYER